MNVEVNRNAKAYAKDEIYIEAPVEKVYSLLSGIKNWPHWQTPVKISFIEGDPAEGKEFSWEARGVTMKAKLHTVKPHDKFGWTGRMAWITAVHNWTIQPVNGKCLVTVEESMKGFLTGLIKKPLKKGMKQSLKELKTAAEK